MGHWVGEFSPDPLHMSEPPDTCPWARCPRGTVSLQSPFHLALPAVSSSLSRSSVGHPYCRCTGSGLYIQVTSNLPREEILRQYYSKKRMSLLMPYSFLLLSFYPQLFNKLVFFFNCLCYGNFTEKIINLLIVGW